MSLFFDHFLAIAASFFLLYLLQSRMIFGRARDFHTLPLGQFAGTYQVSQHTLKVSSKAQISGWSSQPLQGASDKRVLIYFGGRNEDVRWVPHLASYLRGWTIYAFNYRSLGTSTGFPGEEQCKSDAMAIYSYVAKLHLCHQPNFTLMGRSLGTAVALWLANKVRCSQLILLSPFTSLTAIFKSSPLLCMLTPFLRQRFECSIYARHVATRSMVVMANADTTIKHSITMQLVNEMATPPVLVTIATANHNNLPHHEDTITSLRAFLAPV